MPISLAHMLRDLDPLGDFVFFGILPSLEVLICFLTRGSKICSAHLFYVSFLLLEEDTQILRGDKPSSSLTLKSSTHWHSRFYGFKSVNLSGVRYNY